ncbi:contractile injection system protein, VgrG/Pvc8 family [Haloarcula sp. S1CR25-12]|uniref:Contractile injection system protein, VgrG/Pvc8 family n=1 Tax=Haloarcula saliterrae TaxID=2950534 RepID=A0ABU2FE15_9EURY|nr:contractile injection system protein, VgrG/Pvc8 family [Haloarcula sp. S1CR25-12]MDS0260502.1 contractile injection system protein, VgrG/Pvc8 family [Haloarcula sp. S1CR25-12]
MSSSINNHPAYSPRFNVTVGSEKFQEPGGRIADLVVETTFDGADRFSFTLNYPFDEERDQFAGLDWDRFSIGTDVEIAMGYGDDGQLTDLLTGKIQSINTEFTTDRGPSVQVSGYGLLWEMMQGSNSTSWTDTTIGDAIDDVLSSYSFSSVTVESADIKREKLIQDDRSDYQFVDQLATAYGFEFYAERDSAKVVPRSSRANDSDPIAELWYGEDLHDFFGEITDRRQNYQVEVRSWDVKKKEELTVTAGSSTATHKEVFRIPAMSRDEAEQIAETKLNQLSGGTVQAHGETDGIPELRAGVTVDLAELGSRFSGTYHVTNATHRMGASGYRTTFEATEVSG